jgi:peroxiredoxin Q/BCP
MPQLIRESRQEFSPQDEIRGDRRIRMLKTGDVVDDFSLLDQNGDTIDWASLRGSPVVIFFYPKASTPGCTKEACGFQDLGAAFKKIGVTVLGASADSVKRQANFALKQNLHMSLLSDPDQTILIPWGVWGDKKLYGRAYKGIIRSTFLFDTDGKVVQVWSPVRVKGHVEEVLACAQNHAAKI